METSNLVCYSPEPPEAYTRNGKGHGVWVDTQAQWNLAWMSFPELDKYVEMKVGLDVMIQLIDSYTFGTVAGSASEEADPAFPGLARALVLPPNEFLRVTRDGPWEDLPAYKVLGEPWVTQVRKRAEYASRIWTAEVTAKAAIQRAIGNVIHVQFGKGKPPA